MGACGAGAVTNISGGAGSTILGVASSGPVDTRCAGDVPVIVLIVTIPPDPIVPGPIAHVSVAHVPLAQVPISKICVAQIPVAQVYVV